jgi:hypothetical protein
MRTAVFLDRDGTLVEEIPYLTKPPQMAVYLGKRAPQGRLHLMSPGGYCLRPTSTGPRAARAPRGIRLSLVAPRPSWAAQTRLRA